MFYFVMEGTKMFKTIIAIIAALTIISAPANAWTEYSSVNELRGTTEFRAVMRSNIYTFSVQCVDNTTDVFISARDTLFSGSSIISYKVDNGSIKTSGARATSSYEDLSINNPIAFIKQVLKGKDRITIEYQPALYAKEVASFPLVWQGNSFKNVIDKIRKNCNW